MVTEWLTGAGFAILSLPRHIGPMQLLVLFAHPKPSGSIAHRAMIKAAAGLDGVTFHDLYAAYPDFGIDAAREQALLAAHDLIVFQHPFYWYSCPAILKEWMDLVLELHWAYGTGGDKLAGKFLMTATTTGGAEEAYRDDGRNRFHVRELLAPFNQTAWLCGMGWLEPFVIHEGRKLAPERLTKRAEDWRDLLVGLRDGRIDPMKRLAKDYALPPSFARRAA
jgi:glutathione-regulated potassium-efflux system ancillary protein KefG